jgi:hypothetical protein
MLIQILLNIHGALEESNRNPPALGNSSSHRNPDFVPPGNYLLRLLNVSSNLVCTRCSLNSWISARLVLVPLDLKLHLLARKVWRIKLFLKSNPPRAHSPNTNLEAAQDYSPASIVLGCHVLHWEEQVI